MLHNYCSSEILSHNYSVGWIYELIDKVTGEKVMILYKFSRETEQRKHKADMNYLKYFSFSTIPVIEQVMGTI